MAEVKKGWVAAAVALAVLVACGEMAVLPEEQTQGPSPKLGMVQKSLIPTVHIADAQGWPTGGQPTAASGWRVTPFATKLSHPRWVYLLPNGDVLVAESNKPASGHNDNEQHGIKAYFMKMFMKKAGAGVASADQVTLLRDADGDGVAETKAVLIDKLKSPFGMVLVGDQLYIANADAIVKVPFKPGDTRITAAPVTVTDLPAGINHHWTKNIIASRDGTKLYATVGSNSNVAENGMSAEEGRAAIWEVDVATGKKRLFASGLRNPNGMGWEPSSNVLWTVVNERDELGSDLVPDYLTQVADGAFYGWPWSYWGQNVDSRVEPPNAQKVAAARVPDYALGNHVAPLGLAFSDGKLPAPFASGAFIGEHGSWNRKPFAGYKVVFVPFEGGKPKGLPVDFLTGFLSADGKAFGRPVGVALDAKGGVLVADDVGNAVWRVAPAR
jgi:glucose/arabinose dehydrogenase